MLMCAGVLALSATAETVTAVFNVNPPMTCQNCENKIKSNLRFVKGVKNIQTSLEKQEVTVKYDNTKTNEKALVTAFSEIGYKARTKKSASPAGECKGTCCSDKKGCEKGRK